MTSGQSTGRLHATPARAQSGRNPTTDVTATGIVTAFGVQCTRRATEATSTSTASNVTVTGFEPAVIDRVNVSAAMEAGGPAKLAT
jgi:hypothetical protein